MYCHKCGTKLDDDVNFCTNCGIAISDIDEAASPTGSMGAEAPDEPEYAGFWIRLWASIIDTCLIVLITLPLLLALYGTEYIYSEKIVEGPMDFLLTWVFPAAAVICFWLYKSATPGKMLISSKIVDAKSGGKPSTGQFVGRYLGYFVSGLPLALGFIWVGLDKRKQGWHDKLAGTVVVRMKKQ